MNFDGGVSCNLGTGNVRATDLSRVRCDYAPSVDPARTAIFLPLNVLLGDMAGCLRDVCLTPKQTFGDAIEMSAKGQKRTLLPHGNSPAVDNVRSSTDS